MIHRKFAAVLVVGFLLVGAPCLAQSGQTLDEPSGTIPLGGHEGIALGPFIFSPAVDLTWENRDNIFFTPDNEVSSNVWLARARLMFELPVYESYLRFSYTPQYRDYTDYDLENNWSHFVDFSGDFEFSSGLKLGFDYRFVSGNLETREVDPGGELVFGDRQFNKNDFAGDLQYWFSSTNGLTADVSYVTIRYDDTDRAFFYDYDRLRGGAGWIHQMSPTLTSKLMYRHEEFTPKGSGERYRESNSDELTIAFDGKVSPVFTSAIEVGWRTTSYKDVPGYPKADDASGLLLRGSLAWTLGHGSVLTLDLLRQDYPSNYIDQTHYIAKGAGLIYRLQRERLFGHLRVRYQNNDYERPDPIEGKTRSDDITDFGLGIGYRLMPSLSLRGSYAYQKRDSFYRYSYKANMFLIGLTWGF